MKRRFIVVLAILLGATVSLAGVARAAKAKAALEPVRHVYPASTYEDIQEKIDNGGTVYFHYGDYYQVARSFPDLPPSDTDPPKGFKVGAYGNDVHIIGLAGPHGKRPRIHGGTLVFKVGPHPSFGFFGFPVSFRIENLELVDPDLGMPQILFSRIGISVTAIGAQSTINNCKITITGKDADPGHAINHSVGIWFFLRANLPEPPPSGATIVVTNNTIIGSGIHEGMHVDSFWPLEPGFTPPRPFIRNNNVQVMNLGGFPNQAGTNGATLATAILVEGNLLDPIVTNNVIKGDGRSPGLTPPVESVGIGLVPAMSSDEVLDNVKILGNDASAFTGDFQLWIETIVGSSTVARNSFGPATFAGVRSKGHDSEFVNNRFYGPYPGWTSSPDGPGLFWLTAESGGNVVEATKLNGPPHGFDICGQVLDETGGANEIRGDERCRAR